MDKNVVKLLTNTLEIMNDLKTLYDDIDKKVNVLIAMNSEELDWMHEEDDDYSTDYTCDDCDCSDCDDEECPVNKIIAALKEDDDECDCNNCDDTNCPDHPDYREEDEKDKEHLTKLISSLLDEYEKKYGDK